jgi:hypothetical protein
MFKQILDLLPADPQGVVVTTVVAIAIGLGTLTALLGALHSRLTMSLIMLAVGAGLGNMLSIRVQWDMNPGIAIGGCAILLGLLGYFLHRFWVALNLGVLVACVSLFILYDQTQPSRISSPTTTTVEVAPSPREQILSTWRGSTPGFRSMAPWVGAAALAVAGVLGYCFPRFGMALLYSLGGTLLTLAAIRLGHASDQITWLEAFKTGPMTTAAFGFCLLLVGFLTQMALLYRHPKEPAPANADEPAQVR